MFLVRYLKLSKIRDFLSVATVTHKAVNREYCLQFLVFETNCEAHTKRDRQYAVRSGTHL